MTIKTKQTAPTYSWLGGIDVDHRVDVIRFPKHFRRDDFEHFIDPCTKKGKVVIKKAIF